MFRVAIRQSVFSRRGVTEDWADKLRAELWKAGFTVLQVNELDSVFCVSLSCDDWISEHQCDELLEPRH